MKLIALAVLLAAAGVASAQQPPPRPITPEESAALEKNLPKDPLARPEKPRKVLVFYRTEGFVHDSIGIGRDVLRRLGEATGAFTVEESDSMDAFDSANLERFDAVVFLNTTGLKFENPAHRKALLDFVAAGKGVVGIHAATDNFPNWPEGQALMGGVFHGHPWNAGDRVAIKLDDPGHTVNRGFRGSGFWIFEEIYQLKEPYSRENLRVVMSLDMSRPENIRAREAIRREDGDFGISWVKKEGPGRVFYTSLGHRRDIYLVPQILKHFLDGIQFALGDVEMDAVPSARLAAVPVPAPAPEDSTTLQEAAGLTPSKRSTAASSALASLAAQASAQGTDPLAFFRAVEEARTGMPADLTAALNALAAKFAASIVTDAAQPVEARRLAIIARERSRGRDAVPELVPLLADPALAPTVAEVLRTTKARGATGQLESALASAKDPSLRAALETIVGERKAAGLP